MGEAIPRTITKFYSLNGVRVRLVAGNVNSEKFAKDDTQQWLPWLIGRVGICSNNHKDRMPKSNMAHEKLCLGDYFPFGKASF